MRNTGTPPILIKCTLFKPSFVSVINIYVFFTSGKNKTHLEQIFYYLNTWKYGGSVFGTDGVVGPQIG